MTPPRPAKQPLILSSSNPVFILSSDEPPARGLGCVDKAVSYMGLGRSARPRARDGEDGTTPVPLHDAMPPADGHSDRSR